MLALSIDGPLVNLYDMYIANGTAPGFWVKRRTWGDLCAQITFIGELDRHAHCYGHPPVRADLFSFSSRELKQAGAEIMFAGAHKTWRQIPPPPLNVWRDSRKITPVMDLNLKKVAGRR